MAVGVQVNWWVLDLGVSYLRRGESWHPEGRVDQRNFRLQQHFHVVSGAPVKWRDTRLCYCSWEVDLPWQTSHFKKHKIKKKATHLNPNVFKVTGCSSWCDQTGQVLLVLVDVVIFTLFFSVGKRTVRLHGSKIEEQRSHLSHMVLIDVAACLLQPQQWRVQHRHAANVEPDLYE